MRRELRVLLLLGIPVIVVAIGIALFVNNNRPEAEVIQDDTSLIRPDSPTRGPADAPVTVVEFLDPECESCRAAAPFVKQLLERYDGRMRLVVRYFPLHNNSMLAASATEAAGAQGKYWEMQELLFTRQPEWGEKQTPQTDLMVAYAMELELDVDQFIAALGNPDVIAKVQRDQTDGRSLGVTGTPTFFINGRRVTELSADAIIAMIEEELSSTE